MVKGQEKDPIPNSLDELRSWLDEKLIGYDCVYPLGALPEECPWQFNQTAKIGQIIGDLFSPIEKNLPKTIVMLQERCIAMFALRKDDQWYLLYDIQVMRSDGCLGSTIYSGGVSTANPQLREEVSFLGWDIPSELRELYTVHNGFGNFGLGEDYWHCILPSHKLTVLSEYSYLDKKMGYNPDDLLEFFPNGAGNAQFFYSKGEEPMLTVDWDHETRELSKAEGFWEYVDRLLSDVDEDRYDWFGRLIQK